MSVIDKTLKLMSVAAFCIFSVSIANAAQSGGIVYTQLTSTQNQPAVNPSNLISLETVDGIENIGSAATKVTINVSGFYFIIVEGQAGAVTDGAPSTGFVDLWMVRNNTPIPNSTSRQSLSRNETSTMITQMIIQLNAGDSISVGFSASNPAYGFVSIPATTVEPTVTSMTLTAYKL